MSNHVTQDPDATAVDYQLDWSAYLASGDSIVSRLWTINPDESPSLLSQITSATVFVGQLVLGVVYELTEKITTANGVTDQRGITIRCEHR